MSRPMKDSGIEWIGDIPDHWKIARLKDIKSSNNYAIVDGPFGSAISTSDYVDVGVPLVRIVNLDETKLNEANFVYIKEDHATRLERSRFYKGDIIFAKTGATVGKCAINSNIENGILSSSCIKIQVDDKYHNKYFYHFFNTNQFNEALRMACNGTTRDTINLKPFSCLNCVIPPLDEQQRIATFLDGECARIDSVIEKTRASVEEYKKLKQAVITRAVTKGIRPARTFKDSGIDWLGEIPADWGAVKIKYLFTIKKQIAGKEGYTVLSITQKGIMPKNLSKNEGQLAENYSHYQIVNVGDFAMNHMDLLTGWIDISKYYGVTSPDYRVFVLNDKTKCNDKYYLYLMQMCYSNRIFYRVGQGVSGMGRWRLQADKFLNFLVAVPPLDEQREIATFLDEKTAAIDLLIAKKNQLVTELASLKKSLIFEYVTGKKAVQL